MFKRYFLGPLSTIIFLFTIHGLQSYFGWTPSAALGMLPLAVSIYFGGLRSSLTSSLMITFYAFFTQDYDLSRFLQIAISFNSIALLGGLIKSKERYKTQQVKLQVELVDHRVLNGNVTKIREALASARQLINELHQNEWALKEARLIEDRLGNVLTEMVGFEQLWKEIQDVQLWASVPENMKKWQEWRKENDNENLSDMPAAD